MIQSIGFKNFRRFENLEPLSLGAINILVGKNNAGKSTLTKGVMLFLDNLKNLHWKNTSFNLTGLTSSNKTTTLENKDGEVSLLKMPTPYFFFDAETFSNLHIGTFERAKCAFINEPQIEFSSHLNEEIEVRMIIKGDIAEHTTNAPVILIDIITSEDGQYTFDFSEMKMTFTPTSKKEEVRDSDSPDILKVEQKLTKIKNARNAMAHGASNEEYEIISPATKEMSFVEILAVYNDQISKLEQYLKNLKSNQSEWKIEQLENATYDLSYFYNGFSDNPIIQYIRTFSFLANTEISNKLKKGTKVYDEAISKRHILRTNVQCFERAARKLETVLHGIHVEYLRAHTATQKMLLSIDEDTRDINTTVVHDYYKAEIKAGEKAHKFLNRWLSEFEICDSIDILPVYGSGYRVDVRGHDCDDRGWVRSLADMGMGSIQLIILILKLATVGAKCVNQGLNPLVILEEPEQNLHPMLQSRLALMLENFNNEFEVEFLIETHSEYLVRNTQVIVAKKMFKDENELHEFNPFKVNFFNNNAEITPMQYNLSGTFKEKFPRGFFDESITLTHDVIKAGQKR